MERKKDAEGKRGIRGRFNKNDLDLGGRRRKKRSRKGDMVRKTEESKSQPKTREATVRKRGTLRGTHFKEKKG